MSYSAEIIWSLRVSFSATKRLTNLLIERTCASFAGRSGIMNRVSASVVIACLALALLGCATPGVYPVRAVDFEIQQPSGGRLSRTATPEQVAYLEQWIKERPDTSYGFGKISDAEVTGVIIVLLKGSEPNAVPSVPAELYMQIGRQHVVIYRKAAFRYRLSATEMAEFRQSLGLPQVLQPLKPQ